MRNFDDAPAELRAAIAAFFPDNQFANAASIAFLESGWDAFVVRDTTDNDHPCGSDLGVGPDGVRIAAERSVGYFQINACNFPYWEWQRLYNATHNAGTAHMLWAARGWAPWYYSALKLGLL